MTFPNRSCMLTIVLLATFFFVNTLSIRIEKKVTIVELKKICSETTDPTLCLRTLHRDPRTATADISTLCDISIDATLSSISLTNNLLSKLVIHPGTGELRERYVECAKHYGLALGDLKKAKTALANKDLRGASAGTGDANEELLNCQDVFEVPPVEPSQLQARNVVDAHLAFIASTISDLIPPTV